MTPGTCRSGSSTMFSALQVLLLMLSLAAPTTSAQTSSASAASNSGSGRDSCGLGKHVRPIVFSPGFGGSALFNYSDSYSTAYPSSADFFGEDDAADNLALPLQWAANGTQNRGEAGPRSSAEDSLPGLDGLAQLFISAVMGPLGSLASYWTDQNPKEVEMWYPVNWDWRRDFWEQSEAVYNMVKHAKNQTGCNPVVIGHSMGGVLTYTAFTRFREDFANDVHGVIYAAAPLSPFSGAEEIISAGLPWDSRIDASALFTYPTIWALLNPLSASCVNAPEDPDGEPHECSSGQLNTGVVCEDAACGRPADWPEGDPYYIPVDLQDPETHFTYIAGRRSFLQRAGLPPTLSEAEKAHIESVTAAVRKVHAGTIGEFAEEVARLHPPTLTISLSLTEIQTPRGAMDLSNATSVKCNPPVATNSSTLDADQPLCESFGLAETTIGPYDGLLPSQSTFLLNPQYFGEKLQVLNVTRPSPGYLAGGFGSSHSLVLHSSEDAFSSNVNCTEQADRVTYEEGDYPTLEAMVCSVVRRGDAWIPEESSGDASEGSGSSVVGDDSNSSGLRGSRAAHTITAFLVGAVIVTASLIF